MVWNIHSICVYGIVIFIRFMCMGLLHKITVLYGKMGYQNRLYRGCFKSSFLLSAWDLIKEGYFRAKMALNQGFSTVFWRWTIRSKFHSICVQWTKISFDLHAKDKIKRGQIIVLLGHRSLPYNLSIFHMLTLNLAPIATLLNPLLLFVSHTVRHQSKCYRHLGSCRQRTFYAHLL